MVRAVVSMAVAVAVAAVAVAVAAEDGRRRGSPGLWGSPLSDCRRCRGSRAGG